MDGSPKVIIRRCSHVLVYAPDTDFDVQGRAELVRQLCVWEEDTRGARWVAFKAALTGTDPNGKRILRLPREVSDEDLLKAWPSHKIGARETGWPGREVRVAFRSGQYPFKNRDQARIVEYLKGGEGGPTRLVVAGTAAGKSYCTIRSWVESERTEVLLGTFAQNTHLNNFLAELLKFTDLTGDDILVVSDGQDTIRKALALGKEGIARYKAILILHRTVYNCMQKVIKAAPTGTREAEGMDDFSKLLLLAGVGFHVSDECHLELQSLVDLSLLTDVRRTVYLSATPERTDWQEDRVLRLQLPKDRAIYIRSEARLVVRQIRFDSRPTSGDVVLSVNRRGYFDVPWYFDYLGSASRYPGVEEMLTVLVQRAFDEGATGVGVVVGGKLEFLDRVVATMQAAFPERTVGNFSSRAKTPAAKMEQLERDIVITTEKSFGGSVNPTRMSHLVLLAPIASSVWVKQIAGRLRGIDGRPCILFDLWDAGFTKTREQSKYRRTAYKHISKEILQEEYNARTP